MSLFNRSPSLQKVLQVITLSTPLVVILLGASSLFSAPASAMPISGGPNPPSVTCKKQDFFGLEPWYEYMNNEFAYTNSTLQGTTEGREACSVKCFNIFIQTVANDCGQTASDIPAVLLAIIDDLLRIAAMVAIGYVIYGSFQYISSQGNSEVTSQAQTTIINALIGVAIALIAVTAVSFIGDKLGG